MHLKNDMLDRDKFRLYSSSTLIDNEDRISEACGKIRSNILGHLGQGPESTTTWKHAEYNFWTFAQAVDPIFIRVWKELLEVIKENSPTEAEFAWVQSWLNYDTYDTVQDNLSHHGHNCPLHGYVSVAPGSTKTVFDEWEIENKVGNIYVGLGKWKHHVENTAEYSSPRITIGYDVVYGDTFGEGWEEETYQSLPWHNNWIPIVLQDGPL